MTEPKPKEKMAARLLAFWIGPGDGLRFVIFEKVFAISFLYYMANRFRGFREWLTPEGFHYTEHAHLGAHIAPFPLLTVPAAVAFGLAMLAGGIAVVAGAWRRAALLVLFLSAVYVQHADIASSFGLNKIYIVGFLVLLLTPLKRVAVGDSGKRRPVLESAWPERTLQATALIQIFTAGTCKVFRGDWLQHNDVLWTQIQGIYRTEFAAWLLSRVPSTGWAVLQHAALGFELVGPVLLLIPRLRWAGLAMSAGFVLFISMTMEQLIPFMFQIASLLLLFVKPEWFEALRGRINPFSHGPQQ